MFLKSTFQMKEKFKRSNTWFDSAHETMSQKTMWITTTMIMKYDNIIPMITIYTTSIATLFMMKQSDERFWPRPPYACVQHKHTSTSCLRPAPTVWKRLNTKPENKPNRLQCRHVSRKVGEFGGLWGFAKLMVKEGKCDGRGYVDVYQLCLCKLQS